MRETATDEGMFLYSAYCTVEGEAMATFVDHVAHRVKALAQGREGRENESFMRPSSSKTVQQSQLCCALMHQKGKLNLTV